MLACPWLYRLNTAVTTALSPSLFTHTRSHTRTRSMTDLTDLMHKLLGVQCKLYVTRCVTWELEELGEGFEKVIFIIIK